MNDKGKDENFTAEEWVDMFSDKSESDITVSESDSDYSPSDFGDDTPDDSSVHGSDTQSRPAAIQGNSNSWNDLSDSSNESDDNEQTIFDNDTARLSHATHC